MSALPGPPIWADPYDRQRAHGTSGLLSLFNDAGVLVSADIQVAVRLARLCGEQDDETVLAAALAVRGARLGHVCVALDTVAVTASADVEIPVDLAALPWPDPQRWPAVVADSPLIGHGPAPEPGRPDLGDRRPLRLEGVRCYLDRYWRDEVRVATDLLARAHGPEGAADADPAGWLEAEAALDDLGGAELPAGQRRAVLVAVTRQLSVVAGGPGTGKTTTVARILAVLDRLADRAGRRPPRVALAAPTGKAAARLQEALHAAAGLPGAGAERVAAAEASTIHRLLGAGGSLRRPRHHRDRPLPFEVVIVDECSMVSLPLMASLLDAVRPDARLVLVGDPHQLASVEAGAVLGDVVGPVVGPGGAGTPPAVSAAPATGAPSATGGLAARTGALTGSIVVLDRGFRYGGHIAELAEAIRRGDTDATVAVLGSGGDTITWIDTDPAAAGDRLGPVRRAVVDPGVAVMESARAGEARVALDALSRSRLLCAHRHGPYGVSTWSERVEGWLAAAGAGPLPDEANQAGGWYVGRPILVTANDYTLQVMNGDTGVVIATPEGPRVAIDRAPRVLLHAPGRLGAVETVHAMTVHKSQGSQFETVVVVLPDPSSPLLTRELLYTAVTRCRERLLLVGAEASIRTAVARPIARASGLGDRLWGPPPAS